MRNGRLYYLCWQLNPTIMYSSEDLERFYFQYQTEAVPHGVSLQSFCSTNNVPYNLFHKWYKDTRRKIVEVQVDGVPWVPPPLGFRSVFSFSGKPGQEGQSFLACREQSQESVQRSECASRAYMLGSNLEQWSAYPPKGSGLSWSVPSDPKAGGAMLSVTGMNRLLPAWLY